MTKEDYFARIAALQRVCQPDSIRANCIERLSELGYLSLFSFAFQQNDPQSPLQIQYYKVLKPLQKELLSTPQWKEGREEYIRLTIDTLAASQAEKHRGKIFVEAYFSKSEIKMECTTNDIGTFEFFLRKLPMGWP